MTGNDILRSLRYLLNVSDAKVVEILELGLYIATLEEVVSYLKREDEPGYVPFPEEALTRFLNGMVIFKRGPRPDAPPAPIELPVSNNLVMKKIRVAFGLKDTDLIALIEKSGTLKLSKSELGSFLRARDHRNYRECGDQYLRNLLRALSI